MPTSILKKLLASLLTLAAAAGSLGWLAATAAASPTPRARRPHPALPAACAALAGGVGLGVVVARRRQPPSRDGHAVLRGGPPPPADDGGGPPRARVLIVGAGAVGRALADSIEGDPSREFLGFVDDGTCAAAVERDGSAAVLGGPADVSSVLREHAVDEVLVAYAPSWEQSLAEDLARQHPGVRVRVVPSYYDAMLCSGKVESLGDIALIPMACGGTGSGDGRGPAEHAKRLFDVLVAGAGLVALAPLLLVVALLVRASSPGPVLFAQERVGRWGTPFVLLKFRTMRADAEAASGPVLSSGDDDPRVTPVGRWLRRLRLDELPQLINVLKGEMSMVGPRPERPCFVERFTARNPVYARRHAVRPGLTGLAQVRAGYHTDARDKLRFDLFYVSHRSLWLDVSLLFQTLLLVCRSRGH